MLAPKLRFQEFDGNWTSVPLKDFVSFRKGKGISKADIHENGIFECIRYGELYTTYGQVITTIKSRTNISPSESILSQNGDVIIPASGETQIDIATASCVAKENVILGGDLNILSHQESGEWLAYYLSSAKKLEIAQLAQGNSVVHLYSSQLKELKINKPSKEEQTKIATFLSAVDEKIAQLSQKLHLLDQYKQGMMQKLFSQQIRFKADDGSEFGEWVEYKLGEISTTFSGGTPKSTNKEFFIGTIPFIKSGEISKKHTDQFINELALKESSAKLVKKGDLLYALYGATSGQVALSQIDGAINQAVLCIRSKHNIKYLLNFFLWKKDSILSTYLQGGQGNLSAAILKEILIPVPCLEEQTKIANFLSAIDQKIDVASEQLEQAKLWKKGLLQQMFV